MKIRDLFSMAFMNLWRRKLRAFLTVLGMVIGVAAIIVMVSLGIGINESFRQNYEQAGSLTVIQVNNYREVETKGGASVSMGRPQEVTLNDKSVQSFKQIQGVTAVMPLLQAGGSIRSGQYVSWFNLAGVDPKEAEEFGFDLSEGRMPEAGGAKIEMVLGSGVLESFYNPMNGKQALDKDGKPKISVDHAHFQITFDYTNFDTRAQGDPSVPKGKIYEVKIVGRMLETGNNAYYSLMNVETVKKLAKENKNWMGIDTKKYNTVWVKCADIETVSSVEQQIKDMGYGTYSLHDALKAAQESAAQLQMLLGAIGGVSLLIAAIGIMNTMMMSIYERTKEIGIIKVLGCRMRNIAVLFLTEAAYIGLFGGLIGMGISYGLSAVMNVAVLQSVGMQSVIPVYLSLGAVAFSIFVALISGMYPAIRAMRLSALTAIRSE